jgi:parvulin-like peptidyl-prolyl isomerase
LIFNTATGTVVKQVVKSRFGFHIIKVDQKLVDKATGAVSVKLRHILIKVDVDKYIKSLLDNSRLMRYVR